MNLTIQEQIIAAVVSGLAAVRTANGYRTEAGATVMLGITENDPDTAPLTVVLPMTEEAVPDQYGAVICTLPMRVEAFAPWIEDNPVGMSQALLADVIECMTAVTWSLPFSSGGVEVQVGDTITGANSAATGYVVGVTVTSGTWDGGDAVGALSLRRVVGDFSAAEVLKVDAVAAASASGAVSGQHAIARMTGSLAKNIVYTQGGQNDFPGLAEKLAGTGAVFSIEYHTVAGDPYHRP